MKACRLPGRLRLIRSGILLTFLAAGGLSRLGCGAEGQVQTETAAPAVSLRYTSRLWQSDEGLPNNFVRAVVQTRDGYLWVGTSGGLARFDGLRFVVFNPQNTPALQNPNITALCVDGQGTLWIGSYGGGVASFREGEFVRCGVPNGLGETEVTSLCAGRDGSLWIGSTIGLLRFKDGHTSHWTRTNGLLSNFVRAICEDDSAGIWVASGNGLNRWAAGAWRAYTGTNGLPDKSVRGLWRDHQGRIWAGCNSGIACFDGGEFTVFKSGEGLANGFIQAFCEDAETNLWVGALGGMYRFQNGRLHPELDDTGIVFDQINALFADREGSIWAGSREGLIRLTRRRFFTYTTLQGLARNNAMSVLEDRAGRLWVSTWGGGLDCLSEKHIKKYGAGVLPTLFILSMCEGSDGSLWAGADYDGGLIRLKDDLVTHYTWKDGLINAPVHVIHEDRQGILWVGTSKGLSRMQAGRWTYEAPQPEFANRNVRAICEDHLGRLWFGTQNGLSCWDGSRLTTFTVKDGLGSAVILCLHEDADHDLWIGTWGGGLNRWHEGKFSAYTARQGLFSDNVMAVLEDSQGNFWMSSPEGISRLRKSELPALVENARVVHPVSYGRLDGLISVQLNGVGQPAGWKSRDGRLWFPTTKGVVAVDPAVPMNQTPPPVILEEAIVEKQPLKLNGGRAGLADSPIQVVRQRGELEFRFTAPSLELPEKNRFKYMLEGVDADWTEAGTRRVANYHGVDAGAYTFHVMACNNDGVWNATPASISIVLVPKLWERLWFKIGAGLALAAGLTGSVRMISINRLQRRLQAAQRESAVERERARIARDIHDYLGSSLTRIALLGELVEADKTRPAEIETHARQITNSARTTVQSLDEMVWAVSPENDTWNSLAEYLSRYASEFFERTPVGCRLELPLDLPAAPLSSEARHHLFLSVKEALNNILKHARATHARLALRVSGSWVELQIADDGRGFDAQAAAQGNGLVNMRERMTALGGTFKVETQPGKGTTLTFGLPLSRSAPPNPRRAE